MNKLRVPSRIQCQSSRLHAQKGISLELHLHVFEGCHLNSVDLVDDTILCEQWDPSLSKTGCVSVLTFLRPSAETVPSTSGNNEDRKQRIRMRTTIICKEEWVHTDVPAYIMFSRQRQRGRELLREHVDTSLMYAKVSSWYLLPYPRCTVHSPRRVWFARSEQVDPLAW